MDLSKICNTLRDEPMSRHTTFKIGGNADLFLRPKTVSELKTVLKNAPEAVLLGNGSNVLVDDGGIRGVTVTTAGVQEMVMSGEKRIIASCGVLLSQLASFALKNGLSGLEFAAGIPGTVGGGVFMNAGAYGGELADCVVSSSAFIDGKDETITDHQFAYRGSIYSKTRGMIVLSAEFELEKDDASAIRARMDDFASRRKAKQPLEWPSAGSVFKRPPGHYAGELIERCGLKGYSIGGAMVSEKHAGFIINRNNASCGDVLALIDHIKQVVSEKTGVLLESEIKYIKT